MDVSAPEFFKVFMPNFSSVVLLIPPKFIRKYFRPVPSSIVLVDSRAEIWDLCVTQIGTKFYFTTGWDRFVRDYSLEFGELLLFKLVAKDSIEVKIFGIDGCAKTRPYESTPANPAEEKTIIRGSSSEESNEVKIENNISGSNPKESEDDEQFHEARTSRGYMKHTKKPDSKKEKVCRKKVKKAKNVQKNRYFRTTISNGKQTPYSMYIPRVANEGINFGDELVLRSRYDDSKWPVTISQKSSYRLGMGGGWNKFFVKFNLKPGDICIFEIVVGQGNTCFEMIVDVERN